MSPRRRIVIAGLAGLLVAAALFSLDLGRDRTTTRTTPSVAAPPPASDAPRPAGDRPVAVPSAPASPRPETRTSTRPGSTQVVFEVPFGSAPGQLGRKVASESNPEGPMAIAVEGDDVVVLDQANARVQRFRRGVPVATFPVSETVQDLALSKDGRTVVLDRLAEKNVVIHGPHGARVGEVPLAGKGIDDPSVTTGVFIDQDGVWVEREHGNLVRVASLDGASDPARPELPGRLTRDGRRVITAAIADAAAGRAILTAFEREDLAIAWAITVELPRPILQLVLLDSDDAGRVYLGAEGARERADLSTYDAALMVQRFGAEGQLTGRLEVPALATGNESHRPIAIGDDGAVYVMQTTDTGVAVTRHTFSSQP